jgi:hypothetical protein
MKLANDCFITSHDHDPCSNCLTGGRPSNIWTRAVYYEGALAYFEVHPWFFVALATNPFYGILI